MRILLTLFCCTVTFTLLRAAEMTRLLQNNPGLIVDLGVGLYAFPLPMDWDGDGDLDLLVACPDRHYHGVYLFENPAGKGVAMPVFKAGKRLGPAAEYMTLSTVDGKPRLLARNREYPNFTKGDFTTTRAIYPTNLLANLRRVRGNTWRYADMDGDGASDLLAGHDSWDDFGWFGTDWARQYNARGNWTGALPHGWFYWVKNEGTDRKSVV